MKETHVPALKKRLYVLLALSLVAAVYYLRIAYVLFVKAPEESECKCCCSSSVPFSYLLKFAVAVAAIALVVVSVVPGIALL